MFVDKKYLWFLLIFCTRIVLSVSLCADVSLRGKLNDRRTSDFLLESMVWSKSRTECATLCGFNVKCASFFYRGQDNVCRQHRAKPSALNYFLEEGWIGYDFLARTDRDDYTCNQEAHTCYKLHTVTKTWAAARTVCHSEDAELIMLNTDAKKALIEDIVLSYAGSGDFYIGSAYDWIAGDWKWITDNSTVTWITASGGQNECIEMESGGVVVYDSTGCDNREELFFCETLI